MKRIKAFDYPNWIPNIISLLKEARVYKICMILPKKKQIQINLESLKKDLMPFFFFFNFPLFLSFIHVLSCIIYNKKQGNKYFPLVTPMTPFRSPNQTITAGFVILRLKSRAWWADAAGNNVCSGRGRLLNAERINKAAGK